MRWYARRIPSPSYEYTSLDYAKTLQGCIDHKEYVGTQTNNTFVFEMHPTRFLTEFYDDFHAMISTRGDGMLMRGFARQVLGRCEVVTYEKMVTELPGKEG